MLRIRCTMQVCTITAGHTLPTTSGRLRDLVATDSDKLVRQSAEQALVGHSAGGPDSQPWLRDRRLISSQPGAPRVSVPELTVQRREDPDTGSQLRDLAAAGSGYAPAAVRTLGAGWRDDPGTGPLLRDRAVADEGWYVRRAAVQALEAAGGRTPTPGNCSTTEPRTSLTRMSGRPLAKPMGCEPRIRATVLNRRVQRH